MPKRILITGGAGFIGSQTANALAGAGHQVRVLDNLDPQIHGTVGVRPAHLNPSVELQVGDARDSGSVIEALRGIDVVYLLAALTGVGQSMYAISRYTDVNVGGVATLWDVIVNAGFAVEKVILASSRAVYGEGAYSCARCGRVFPSQRVPSRMEIGDWGMACPQCGAAAQSVPTREPDPLQPQSIYASTKAFQEEICRRVSLATRIPVVILRYFNVYGRYQALANPYTGIVPVFWTNRMAGRPIPIYEDGMPGRDFVHVEDVVRANLLALDCDNGVNGINVGSGQCTTIAEMATAICAAMGTEPRLEFTGQFRVGDVRSCYADCSEARRALGFEATKGLGEGLADLIEWLGGANSEAGAYDESVRELQRKGVMRAAAGAHG